MGGGGGGEDFSLESSFVLRLGVMSATPHGASARYETASDLIMHVVGFVFCSFSSTYKELANRAVPKHIHGHCLEFRTAKPAKKPCCQLCFPINRHVRPLRSPCLRQTKKGDEEGGGVSVENNREHARESASESVLLLHTRVLHMWIKSKRGEGEKEKEDWRR